MRYHNQRKLERAGKTFKTLSKVIGAGVLVLAGLVLLDVWLIILTK